MEDLGVYKPTSVTYPPKKAKVIGCMMVLVIKRKPNGNIDKYKARLVALGNHQGRDTYDIISSGTAKSQSVKLLIALQAKLGAKSCVMDIKGAYLKSLIKEGSHEDIYIRLTDGRVVKLLRYLYGLKQAGYEWQQNITATLLKLGYSQSIQDPLTFYRRTKDTYLFMVIHVDDFFAVASHSSLLVNLHRELIEVYQDVTVDADDMLAYLGMQMGEGALEGSVKISQPGYIIKLLTKYNVNKKIHRTPMSSAGKKLKGDDEPFDKEEYLALIGSINYLAVYTRPDLLYAVSKAAQKCAHPTRGDFRRALRMVQYLQGTMNDGITFRYGGDLSLHCYVDAGYNQDEDAKSQYGYMFSLGSADAAFYAVSRKLKLQVLSSTEAEYVALCEATREAVWLRLFMIELGFNIEAVIMWEDNQPCITQVNSENISHKVGKHINPKFHFARDQVRDKIVSVQYVSTHEQTADLFTKVLTVTQFEYLRSKLMDREHVEDVFPMEESEEDESIDSQSEEEESQDEE